MGWSVAVVAIGRIYATLVTALILFLAARLLGPPGHGVLASAISWSAIVAQLVCISFPQVVPFWLQKYSGRAAAVRLLAPTLLKWAAIQSALGACILLILLNSDLVSAFRALPAAAFAPIALLLPALLLDEYFKTICVHSGDLPAYNRALIYGRTIGLLAACSMFFLRVGGIFEFALVYLAAYVAPILLLTRRMAVLVINRLRTQNDGAGVLEFLRSGIRLFPNTIGTHLLLSNGVLVGSFFLEAGDIGWYQLGMQLVLLITLIPQSFSTVMFARLADSTPAGIWRDQRRYMIYVLMVVFLAVVAVCCSGRWWIGHLLGEAWLQGASITLAVVPVALTLAFAQAMTPQWLGRGLFSQTSLVTAITALINTALNIWLIPAHGVWALVWSSWICLGVLTLGFQLGFFMYCNLNPEVPSLASRRAVDDHK